MSGSGPFGSLSVSGSGMDVYQTWIDAVADNIANINTIRPMDEAAFQARMVVAEAVVDRQGQIGQGARVREVQWGDPEGLVIYNPYNPLADEEGFVRAPNVDLSTQMSHLIIAQRAYQANVAVFERARDAYQQALGIGR
ncbi:MAG: flagellar basal body rod protein FlgC [Actinomycetia bacterium]|nr:flagellar basal body rod protein FlgC [Actinomycetes bacterium]